MADSFEKTYPNITDFVADGVVEIGYEYNTKTFIRAYDEGGMVWEGKGKYKSPDDALRDLEEGLKNWFEENY
jgi:hypothetical protein